METWWCLRRRPRMAKKLVKSKRRDGTKTVWEHGEKRHAQSAVVDGGGWRWMAVYERDDGDQGWIVGGA